LLALLFVIAAALPTIYPTGRSLNYSQLSAADMIRYEVETGALGGTSYDEFKPIWGDQIPDDPPADIDAYVQQPFRIQIAQKEAQARVTRQGDSTFEIDSPQSSRIVFRQFYFPGWQVSLDGKAIDASAEARHGLLQVDLPAGQHQIELAYKGTGVQHLAALISLGSLPIALIVLLRGKSVSPPLPEPEPLPQIMILVTTVTLLGFAIFNAACIQPHTRWFRQQSAPDTPATMETRLDINFGGAYTLLGYSLPRQQVEAGSTLPLTLFWRAQQPLRLTHGVLLQIQNLSHSGAWAALETPFIGTNPIAHDPAHYVSQTYQLALTDDAAPYVGQIGVQLIDALTESPLPASNGDQIIYLPQFIEIHRPDSPAEARLNYRIEDRVRLQCASTQRAANQLQVELFWQVDGALPYDTLSTLVHGRDAAGGLVSQGDAPLLGGDYPPSLWRSGQTLHDYYLLDDDPTIVQVAVGLYTAERRLNITRDGQPVPDNIILLPLDDRACR
jgi:hypothetical protein